MNALFRLKTIVFALLAISLGSATGVALATHSVASSHGLGSVAVRLAGQSGESGATEASPEPTESPEAEPSEAPRTAPATSPTAEPTESPDAEPAEPAKPAEEASPTPAPAAPATTSTQTFTLTGGTVTLSCTGSNPIVVDSLTPNAGFTAEQGREDSDQTVEIRFESDSHESRMQADCSAGQVQLLEMEEKDS